MEPVSGLGGRLSMCASSSNNSPPVTSNFAHAPQFSQVNESLYEVHTPKGRPTMRIYFFHGLQFGDASEAHFRTTWQLSEDRSCVWPQTWLAEDFPNSQIFLVSYDGAVQKSPMDMYLITENLMHDFLDQSDIGQESNCPIILVGHCFGGMVIKELCLKMRRRFALNISKRQRVNGEAFLDDMKGIFYYDTPHHGIPDLHKLTDVTESPLLSYFEYLSKDAERLNYEFRQLRQSYAWRIHGLGASLRTKLNLSESVMIVPEPSARDCDFFNVADGVDHYTICKPRSKKTRSYYALKHHLNDIANDHEPMGQQCVGLPLYCPGLKERAYKVEEMRASATVVGIVGMGGIGKTTIALQVFNNISREFEYTLFVNNVKGIPPHELQDWLHKHFYRNGVRVDGDRFSWNDLKGKKVLIVMDDVDSETQLTQLRNMDLFGSSSCLIVTTRNQGVLRIYPQHAVYDVDLLTGDEAKKLFCQNAFVEEGLPNINPLRKSTHLENGVVAVVKKCQGLPLTLELMGCYLRGHDNEAELWKEAIEKLGRAQAIAGDREDRLFASLQVMVDALSEEERKMFLEAGTFFFEQPVEEAVAAWRTAYESSITAWKNLLSRSMVKEHEAERWEDGSKFKQIWVHEHLRDLGKKLEDFHMICMDEVSVEKAMDLLNANGVKTETLSLKLSTDFISSSRWDLSPPILQLSSLEKLENLKYLELDGVWHEYKGSPTNFPRKLSLLRCIADVEGPLNSLPLSLQGMNNLAVLELSFWKVAKEFSEGLGNLVNLRFLSLRDFKGLDRLPENFGDLNSLVKLTIGCETLASLPESFSKLSSLKEFHLGLGKSFERLPTSFGNLCALEKLVMERCSQLKGLPERFGHLKALKTLTILGANQVEELPDSFGELSALTDLDLNCPSLEGLPASFGHLCALKFLSLRDCRQLKRLPESFGDLCALENLVLGDCSQLKRLPESFGHLKALKALSMDTFFHPNFCLEELPESFGHLKALQSLTIQGANQVEELPDSFGKLSALTDLRILGCPSLERLPTSFGNLCALENLRLEDCSQLKSLPESFGRLKALKSLTIQGANQVEELPDSFWELSALTHLRIRGCPSLERLPARFGDLCALENLRLEDCSQLKRLPESFGRLNFLKELFIHGTVLLEELSECFGDLSALTKLSIVDCSSPEGLPAIFGDLFALEDLLLKNCSQLRRLPESFGRDLKALKNLNILGANQVEELPDSFGELSALTHLMIQGCPSLERLPASFGNLCALESLMLQDCSQLKRLPESFGSLKALKTLIIQGANQVEELPDSFGKLSALKDLRIRQWNRGCPSLERLPASFGICVPWNF